MLNMRRSMGISLWVSGLMVCFVGGAFAQGEGGFSVEAIGAMGAGDVAYEISASGGGDTIKSRLEFPLDGTYVGADARFNMGGQIAGVKNVTFGAKLLTNISDPSEDMNDYDWINGRLVGDTASDTEARSMLLELYFKGDIITQRSIIIRGIAGFRHEDYAFEIYGLDGYYLPPIGDGPETASSDLLVLTYDMTHDWVYGGIEGELTLSDSFSVEANMAMGIGFIEDRDDHVLRGKISEAEFVSFSIKAAVHVVWYITDPMASTRFYVKAGVEGLSMVATGEQDQYFEDGSAGFYSIDDEIEMTFVTGNAMVGCDF
jgi:hypothetical protein